MGLDSVELLLAIEAEFGIEIDDRDAEKMTTPRKVADYLASRIAVFEPNDGRCLSQAAFHRIRSVLVSRFAAVRAEVRPTSRFDRLLNGNFRLQWRELIAAVEAHHAPKLRCRPYIQHPLVIGLPLVCGALSYLAAFPPWAVLGSLVISWILGFSISQRLADVLPPAITTVADLVPYVRAPDHTTWTSDYVLRRVIQITAMQMGIPIEKIEPDHDFVKDLGVS